MSFVAIEGHQRICVQKNVSGTVSDETEGESKERCRIYILACFPLQFDRRLHLANNDSTHSHAVGHLQELLDYKSTKPPQRF